jgi:PKD repeat protein
MPSAPGFGAVRVSLLAACALALAACDGAERLTRASDDVTDAAAPIDSAVPIGASSPMTAAGAATSLTTTAPPSLTAATGGVPFGFFHQPTTLYSATYTGALRGVSAGTLLAELEAAKRVGGSVIISMVGADRTYKNDDGTFSLERWKGRLAPYRSLNFTSYITDGTIIGHYLIDEPNDPSNWAGTMVSPATLEEMALYSKQLWPTMPTIVRTSSSYLRGRTYQYLDAAWAQYHQRFGAVSTWLNKQTTDARNSGLALVAGLNSLAGGTTTGGLFGFYMGQYAMGAAELESWGTAILADPYPCAFIMWRYNEHYSARADIQAAMASLAARARARAFRSCRGGTQGSPPPPPTNQPPIAAFTAPSCTPGVPCQFRDASTDADGAIASRTWTFGDGRSSTLRDPTNTYATANTYTVTLTVTDDRGASRSISRSVIVSTNNLPTAAFTTPSCVAGTVCQFNDASTDTDGTIASRTWTFGDGRSSTLRDPTNTYATANTYTVTLSVTDDRGGTNSISRSVTVTATPPPNQPPTAAFTAPSCTAGVLCQFNDGSTDGDGTIATRAWTFGDGRTSPLRDPTNTYATANTYTVTLTVTDDRGATNSVSRSVTASPTSPSNQSPTAAFTAPSCTVGRSCQFNDGSSDADGTIASRTWTFGDGGSSTLKDPTRTYTAANTYTVTLTVTDNRGGTNSISKSVPATLTPPANSPLRAAFTTPSCSAGVPCQFTDSSTDTDGTIASWTWTFGNGKTSTKRHPTPTYAAGGTYTVTLAVTDNRGRTNSVSKSVTVTAANSPPTAAFVAPSCTAGIPCQFTDGSTDGDGTIATRSWAFGDGTTSTEASPQVTYASAGSYTVTLTVTDDDGATNTVSHSVTVNPPNNPPTAAFTAPSCTAGTPCLFTDTSGDGDGTIATRSWAFGDGTTSTEASPTVTYALADAYNVTLTVTDDDGATNSVSHSVTVTPAAPPPATAPIVLAVTGSVRNNAQYMTLTWTGGSGTTLDVYRDNVFRTNTPNDGVYTNTRAFQGPITYTYKLCEVGSTTRCSNLASVTF